MVVPEHLHEKDRTLIRSLVGKLEDLSRQFDRAAVAEYIALFRNPWRLMYLNFLSGIMRGFGIAVGFSAVGALFLYLLGHLASLNLPVIGHFIAEVLRFVEMEMQLR